VKSLWTNKELVDFVYDNTVLDSFYCPELIKQFYTGIDASTIDLIFNQFVVHFNTGDLLVTLDTIAEVTQISSLPQHTAPLPLIDYMAIMGVRCTQLDRGLEASTIFRNVHCVGR